MKLTSKGMLKSLMLCAGMFSLSAVAATDYVADSFESGTDQTLVRQWEPGGSGTGFKWTSSAGESAQDASKIVSGSVSYQGAKPMDAERFGSPTDTRILSLDTMGETLSRDAGDPAFFGTGSTTVYVDSMVKFVKSEEAPTLPGVFKAAVYADVNTNLVIVSAIGTHTTALKVDPDTWYRLTIELGSAMDGQTAYKAFRVRLNGDVVSVLVESQPLEWLPTNDNSANENILQSVDFQGTGFVDQLVVTDVNPYAPTVILLSLTGLENATVTPAPTAGKTASGTEITISANAGFVLSNVTFTNVVVSNFRFGQSLTFTPVGAADDVIAISTVATNAPVTSFGDKNVNAGKLAKWLGTYANATTGSADYDSYLLNIDPANYPTSGTTFDIESIVVAADTATITLSFGSVDLANINGSLVIQKFTALGGTPTEVTVTPSATVEVDMTGYSFIKAVIK